MGEESRGYLAEIEAKLGAAGLGGEFRYHGTLDRAEKIHFLQGLDVVSVPSPYVEPKGLYLLEALANGVPFVQPAHGAFPEIQERTGGGVLTEPGDTQQLAEALLGLARDPERRRELGRRGAAAAVQERFGVARMAERTEALLSALAAGAPGCVSASRESGWTRRTSPLPYKGRGWGEGWLPFVGRRYEEGGLSAAALAAASSSNRSSSSRE